MLHESYLFGNEVPALGRSDHGTRVHQAVAERMGKVAAERVFVPVRSSEVPRLGSLDHNVLDVSPGEVGIGLQGQGDDAGGHGGAGTGPRVPNGARVVQVCRDDLLFRGSAGTETTTSKNGFF